MTFLTRKKASERNKAVFGSNERIGRCLRWIWEERGAVSLFMILVVVPIFLFCGVLIDVMRYRMADKEAESAVKAGVRSVLSSFSPALQRYGLYAVELDKSQADELFTKVVQGNLSGAASAPRFSLLDHRLESGGAQLTPVYSLANHTVLKQQILEEMKYRAPIIYSLELLDKLKKTNVASGLGQASRFAGQAEKVEELLEARDRDLDKAWQAFDQLANEAARILAEYEPELEEFNRLSGLIGLHTLEDVNASLESIRSRIRSLEQQISQIDRSIASIHGAVAGAAEIVNELYRQRRELVNRLSEANNTRSGLESLLGNIVRYGEQLFALIAKAQLDEAALHTVLTGFQQERLLAMQSNEALNDELRRIAGTSRNALGSEPYAADGVFQAVPVIDKLELELFGSEAATAVSLFNGISVKLQDSLLFNQRTFDSVQASLKTFSEGIARLVQKKSEIDEERGRLRQLAEQSKRESRTQTEAALEQIRQAAGACHVLSGADPYAEHYDKLLGNAQEGKQGYYQMYLELNSLDHSPAPLPEVRLDNAEQARATATKLFALLEQWLGDIRDEFYMDEFAVSKFSYRTLGLEKAADGAVKTSKELSRPEEHPLKNQELEFLLYGAKTCLGNQSLAYAEMFAFRLAVRVSEALLAPRNQALAAGSPLAVLLAALAEGAVKAQQDMMKLIQGEAVPVMDRLSALTMTYKDYLRLFLLIHSRDAALLSRMQALLHLNTGIDLRQAATYVSGSSESSFRLMFLPDLMKMLGTAGFTGCEVKQRRCMIVKNAHHQY